MNRSQPQPFQVIPARLCCVVISISIALSWPIVAKSDDDPITERLSVAGTFLTSRIDANGDGEASSWCTIQIKGGYQGQSMMQCVNEDVFAGVTPECPGGVYVVDQDHGGTGFGARTFPSATDQILVQLTERQLCIDAFGQVTGTDHGLIIGGTGRYAGASGSYSWEIAGQLLYFDLLAQPAQLFGSLLGTGEWEIHLAADD